MAEEEAQKFGVSEEERRLLFRVDSAKVNLATPSATARRFRLVGVKLGNGDEPYPNRDEVQTVEPWMPPDLFEGCSADDLNKTLDRLSAGIGDGRLYSVAPSARERAAWRVLHEICQDQSETRCRNVIKAWAKNGLVVKGTYYDKKERKENEGIVSAKTVGQRLRREPVSACALTAQPQTRRHEIAHKGKPTAQCALRGFPHHGAMTAHGAVLRLRGVEGATDR
jgi:hypothetical protein